jgi:hypothetical protein
VREEVARVRALSKPQESAGTIYFDAAAESPAMFEEAALPSRSRFHQIAITAGIVLVCAAVGAPFLLSRTRSAPAPSPAAAPLVPSAAVPTSRGLPRPAAPLVLAPAGAADTAARHGEPAAAEIQTFELSGNAATGGAAPMPANGYLRIVAVDGAEVWVDGQPAGVTPLAELPAAVGTREVVVRHPEYGEARYSVEVRSARVTPVSATLRTEPPPTGVEAMPNMNAPLRVIR